MVMPTAAVFVLMGVFLGAGSALVTYWALKTFMGTPIPVSLAGALVNGIIIGAPLVRHYWVIKL